MTEAAKFWMAVYTKPRSEKKVAERLSASGFEVYCPLQTTIKQWSDRKKKVKVPVFPSYVFVRILDNQRLGVLQDPGILNFVFWLGKPAIIKDEEILNVMNFLSNDLIEHVESLAYKKGDKVDVVAGPFIGQEGIVEELQKTNITVLIESMGIILKVKLKPQHLLQ